MNARLTSADTLTVQRKVRLTQAQEDALARIAAMEQRSVPNVMRRAVDFYLRERAAGRI